MSIGIVSKQSGPGLSWPPPLLLPPLSQMYPLPHHHQQHHPRTQGSCRSARALPRLFTHLTRKEVGRERIVGYHCCPRSIIVRRGRIHRYYYTGSVYFSSPTPSSFARVLERKERASDGTTARGRSVDSLYSLTSLRRGG